MPLLELPVEIEQTFKKIVKKGSTTRSKGFNELISYCKCEQNDISLYADLLRVPFLKIFTKFAVCPEKSSRLAVAELTSIFIAKMDVKIFLQPILKEILTLWLLSLFDPVGEISAIQRKNLDSVFGAKLKILLEKYEEQIVSEVCEFKFERLKEICVSEMEATAEEAESIVELVKTEIVGLINLMHVAFLKLTDLKKILFLNDKEIGSPRRAALYRLASKMENAQWYGKQVNSLLLKETSPSALPAALEFIGNSGCDVIKKESFALNVFANAPVTEFKKFSGLLLKFRIEESVDWIVKICGNNNLMNRDRFLVFWKDVAVIVFNGFGDDASESSDILARQTLSPFKTRALGYLLFRTTALCSFLPLSLEETMKCVQEAFSDEEIREACRGKIHPQAIYALSSLKECNNVILDELVMKMKVVDLQNKELMKVIPEDLLTRRLCDSNEILSVPEIVRLIQSVNPSGAIEILKHRGFVEWEKMLKSSLLKRDTVKSVLFELSEFREFARENLNENSLVISCAFQSKTPVFDERICDFVELVEVFNELSDFELECPLLKLLIFQLAGSAKLRLLSVDKKKILYKFLEVEKNAELFVAIGCEDEDFYPIEFVKKRIVSCRDPSGLVEIVIYKSSSRADELLLRLLEFPLKQFKNQRVACRCAVLFNSVAFLNFEISLKEFVDCEADNFELFCLSIALENSTYAESVCFAVPTTLKDALLLLNRFKSLNNAVINEIVGNLIFNNDEKVDLLYISLILSYNLIPIRSDNLSGLIDSLQQPQILLLLLAAHLDRKDLQKEFWQVQFREKIKALVKFDEKHTAIESELKLRVAAGIWNKLSDPEIEILKDCGFETILTPESFKTNVPSYCFESVGAARLVLMAAPFLDHFELNSLKTLFAEAVNPAMLLAFRGVYLQLHLDEQLVAASHKLNVENLGIDEIGEIIFPFYAANEHENSTQKFAVLLEMFVSAAEGSRDDLKLLSLYGDVFKSRLLPDLVDIVDESDLYGTLESFDFIPRDFETEELIRHVLFRLCSLFPLIVCGFGGVAVERCANAQEILMTRELARIRRQAKICVDSVEITLKPSITMTTKSINLRVRFMDEIELSIDLILPETFPLQPIRVEGREKSGLADSKWKSSLLSLQVILRSPTTFSGNLIDAIKRWQANALKLFQGLEECAVCYSVLHASDKSLPGPACKQCKHKFHATCLYKWFKSSGNATCPLCRALF